MLITTDKVYNFIFKSPFDPLNGFYLVQKIFSYDEIIADNVDMVKFLYSKVSLTEDDYTADRSGYLEDQFYKIKKMNETEEIIIYVPTSQIDEYPDPNVSEYHKLMLMLNLGVFANPDDLTTLSSTISEIIEVDQGVSVSPELLTYAEVWMKNTDYTALEVARAAVSGDTVNYYSEAKNLTEENARLQSENVALRNILTQLLP